MASAAAFFPLKWLRIALLPHLQAGHQATPCLAPETDVADYTRVIRVV